MKIEVSSFIKKEVERLNTLFEQAAQIAEKEFKPFAIEDYTYLKESQAYFGVFSVPYFLAYSAWKDVEHRIKTPYPGTIWYWKKDVDQQKAKDFLPMQPKLMYDTLQSYISLLKTNHHLQALILFRSYIEYSSQFYASLLDYEFFRKYTGTEVLDERYKQLWFSELKPAKVLLRIKNIHEEIFQLLKEKKVSYSGTAVYRRVFNPFDSNLRGLLYSSLSELAHGTYPALIEYDDTKLYGLVWLCGCYLIESQAVIDEFTSIYFNYSPGELFQKWITIEVYLKSRESNVELYLEGK